MNHFYGKARGHLVRYLLLAIFSLFICHPTSASKSFLSYGELKQARVISGKVTDTNGIPLIGVTVLIKETSQGTITDIDGYYSLELPPLGQTLSFSYIGYNSQELSVRDKDNIDVVLQENSQDLDEVIVVGYGVKKKSSLTGSVASVSGKELLQAPVASVSNALAGKMPGVIAVNSSGAPGSSSSLSIRGSSTLNNNSPLIVVDGVPRDDFNAFDPNEIESITVLKDGAAAAIYGARANNGVFLVTTKRGKQEKVNVSYTGIASLQKTTMYPTLMNAYEYASATNQALNNAGYDINNPVHSSRYYTDKQLENFRLGKQGADWYNEAFRKNSLMQNHNLTISGGSNSIRYFLSLGILNQDGMYDNIGYRAYKFRSNTDIDITSYLTIGAGLEGRYEVSSSPSVEAGSIFRHAARTNPTFDTYYPDGRPVNTSGEHVIEEIKHSGYNRQKHNTFQGTLNFDLKLNNITKGLSVRGNVSFGKYFNFGKHFDKPYTTYTENESGEIINTKTVGGVGGKPKLSESFYQTYSTFWNIGAFYNRTFDKHYVDGLFLLEQNGSFGDQFSGSKQDFSIENKDELFASGPTNQSLTGSSSINDIRKALVGRIGYTYADKYIFETSFRYDGSYKFPKGKRFGFFPSISVGWRISEEPFIKDRLPIISNLKPRVSFAQVGNDRVNPYQFEDAYMISSNNGPVFNQQEQTLIYYNVYPNPDITWETSNNYNFGIDLGLFNNKLNFEFDYFFKNTKNILWSKTRSVPATFGRELPNENYAQVKSRGYEMSLSYANSYNGFEYSFSGMMSYSTNKVTRIDDPANAQDYQKQMGRVMGFRTGYKALGLFKSQEEANEYMGGQQFGVSSLGGDIKYADINNDNIIDSNDQTIISWYNNTPKIMYGLSGDLKWKNFDFNFLLQGAAQRNLMLSGSSRVTLDDGGNSFKYLLDAWSPENPNAKYPLLWTGTRSVNNQNSDFWLKNANYLRLKTISLGYTFPSINLKSLNINGIRLYLAGQNLLTWTPLEGFDPEAGAGHGGYYPQQKTISIGLNINF